MSGSLRVLIIGGYGTFGGHLVALLETEPGLTLIVAGRSPARAEAFCKSRGRTAAALCARAFDRDGDTAAQVAAIRPDILVDASGPFQSYGAQPYRVIEACLAAGVSYLDLADGSDFVAGVAVFDKRARAAGLYVLSGVSTCPALTAAAARELLQGMTRVDSIRAGIAPSPRTSAGETVARAIADYAGRPIIVRRNGVATTAYPFTEQVRFTIAPPGSLPLRSKLFSLVDVPDLRVLPELWPGADIWVGAAPEPELLHRWLIALAWLVRAKLLRGISRLAPLMHFVTKHALWGEHRGGMFVEVMGADANGAPVKRSWHLIAEGDDGPFIPAMAAAALVRKACDGQTPQPDARAAIRELELDDFKPFFSGLKIIARVRDDSAWIAASLYARVLGNAWEDLPPEIRTMHTIHRVSEVEGRASVERGRNLFARVAAWIAGFPCASEGTSVKVRFDVADGVETWTRTFGAETFCSRQFAGHGRWDKLICEQFGPLIFAMALVREDTRLRLVLRGWSLFGLRLPMWLCLRVDAFETVEDGRFRFHVEVAHRLTGLIVRYRGWLEPAPQA